jgi:hypothetical protein
MDEVVEFRKACAEPGEVFEHDILTLKQYVATSSRRISIDLGSRTLDNVHSRIVKLKKAPKIPVWIIPQNESQNIARLREDLDAALRLFSVGP